MKKNEIELVNDLWQLWEDIHMAGQLVTNKDFTPKYKELNTKVKLLNLADVTVSLPADKVIEDWYTKDFDSIGTRFWEEAPYCTHGDRVEEIKDALHKFIKGNER
jgi:hypothetical protein